MASLLSEASNLVNMASGLGTYEWNVRSIPDGFRGQLVTEVEVAHPTPCIGMVCGGPKCGMHTWYPAGTTMAAFRDIRVSGKAQWQHKCMPCLIHCPRVACGACT